MARTGNVLQRSAARVLGWENQYLENCPCCEYTLQQSIKQDAGAARDCKYCPMANKWAGTRGEKYANCYHYGSVWRNWYDSRNTKDRQKYAKLIIKNVEEVLKNEV